MRFKSSIIDSKTKLYPQNFTTNENMKIIFKKSETLIPNNRILAPHKISQIKFHNQKYLLMSIPYNLNNAGLFASSNLIKSNAYLIKKIFLSS